MFYAGLIFLGIGILIVIGSYFAPRAGTIQPTYSNGLKEPQEVEYGYRKWTLLSGAAVIGLGIVFLVIASVTTVSTKNVGIETTFGKPSGELSNGIHKKWPWEKVTEMDAAIQTDTFVKDNCLQVRIANQQTACVYTNFQWRINPNAAQELYRDYRTFDHVRDALVTRRLTAVVNEQLANYNPLNSVAGADLPAGEKKNPSLAEIAHNVNEQMKKEIGGTIEVLSTIIPIMTFDPETQARINQLQQQVALTRVALQSQKTASAQAAANKKLSASVNNSPNVLVSHCYQILETMVKNGQNVPAGFSCWPGGGVAAVIAGGGKNG